MPTLQVAELHIASLVVHAAPARLASVRRAMHDLAGVEVHAASLQGKLVVTLEQPSAEAMTAKTITTNVRMGIRILATVIDEPRPIDYYDLSSCNLVIQETPI